MSDPAQTAALALVEKGAAFVRQPGGFAHVVGILQRIDSDHWFWFEAGRDDEFGMHRFRADRAEVVHDGLGVRFTLKGEFVGYLTTIQQAISDKSAAATARGGLNAWKHVYAKSASLRNFIRSEIRK